MLIKGEIMGYNFETKTNFSKKGEELLLKMKFHYPKMFLKYSFK